MESTGKRCNPIDVPDVPLSPAIFLFIFFILQSVTITVVTLQIQVNSLKNAQLVIVDPRIKMGI